MEALSDLTTSAPDPRHVRDHGLAVLAATQRGVVHRDQLKSRGYSDTLISERQACGWLHKIGPSVYAVGHTGISRRGRGLAALLQVGEDAGLSYETAGRLWRTLSGTDGPIHVSVRNRAVLEGPPGVEIHRPRNLRADEIVEHRGLRVTTPERTVLDLATKWEVTPLTRMLEQMVTVLNRSPDDLYEWGHALPRRVGRSKILHALDWVAGPAVIRSHFEEVFRSVCQEAGLPIAATNHHIGRWEYDAVFLKERLAVELDSWRWHGGRWQFHQDRRKGLAAGKAGFELVRLTWWQLKHERREVVDGLLLALERGRDRELGRAFRAAGR